MATLKTTLALHDGMSAKLQTINRAVENVTRSFKLFTQAMQVNVNNGVIINIQNNLNNVGNTINKNTIRQREFNNEVRRSKSLIHDLWTKMKLLTMGYMGIQGVGKVFQTADNLTMANSRIGLMSDVASGKTTSQEVNDKVYAAALRSRGNYLDMMNSVSKLALQTGDLFGNSDEVIAFMENYNKMAVVSGANAQQSAAALIQITQALASGELRGDELRSVMENMPVVAQAIAKEMGTTVDQVRELGFEGKISSEILKNAMFNSIEEIDEKFSKIPYTWGQVWETVKTFTLKVFTPILKAISGITSNKRFIAFANEFGNVIRLVGAGLMMALNALKPVLNWIYDTIAAIYNFFKNNWGFIAPIVLGIAGAFAIYTSALMLAWTWQKLTTIATTALTVAKIIGTFATHGITTATARWAKIQLGLNGALWSCPLTWIVLAIIAVIVVVYLAVAAINKWAGTSISATGIIAGAFNFVYGCIYNVIATIWDLILSFAEFFVNVWNDPKRAFMELALNIGQTMIDTMRACQGVVDAVINGIIDGIQWAINKCIDGLNYLWGMVPDKAKEWLGMEGEISHVDFSGGKNAFGKALDRDQARIDAIRNALGEAPEGWSNLKDKYSMGRKDLGAAYNEGYKTGEEFADLMSDKQTWKAILEESGLADGLNLDSLGLGGLNDIGKALSGDLGKNPALDKIAKSVGDIANDTSDIAASDEELSFMKDMAEREAINRYTLTDLKFNMTNNNSISNGMNLDEILSKIEKKVYDTIMSSASGAHI